MKQSPHLAILGAGPTGLDAALAAVDAGLPFTLYEAGTRAADHIRQWGHVRLFSPWNLDVSPRIRRALETLEYPAPTGSACPTGRELVDNVFQPLAESHFLAPHLRLQTRILALGREGLLKHQAIGDPVRDQHRFRLLLQQPDGSTRTATADVVLDCTGTYSHPNPTGDGGIPAPGEEEARDRLVRTIPDVRARPELWLGQRTVVIGAGHSAQTAIVDLAALARTDPDTDILWAVRREKPEWSALENDPLTERSHLVHRAQDLARGASSQVRCLCGVVVESIERGDSELVVAFRHLDGRIQREPVDRIVSLTGFSGDHHLYRQLQVHECWATSGPMKLAASLLADASTDCLAQTGQGAETLKNPEPGFFLLGSKSYGRNSTFLMRAGWQQVDEVFSLL